MIPRRIQRKRARGWRMPEGAVYVGRPSRWGNPWKVDDLYLGDDGAYRNMTAADVVERYRWFVHAKVGESGFTLAEEARSELRGRDLVCWCLLDRPCHADVLLEIANGGEA